MIKRIAGGSLLMLAVAMTGYSVRYQLHSVLDYRGTAIESQTASLDGIGVLTPSMPTGYEADKQALGDALGSALQDMLPAGRIVPLGDMLSAINSVGLARSYSDMLTEYERPVSFSQVAKLAAEHLVDKLGESGNSINEEVPPEFAASL